MENKTIELSKEIFVYARENAVFLPIDRKSVLPFLDRIMDLDRVEFIFYQMELVNQTYTVQFFACLLEVWEDITIEDIENLVNNFSNIHSFYTLIEFTHKYLEIDILPIIQLSDKYEGIKRDIQSYLTNQYACLIKDESDYEDIDNGIFGFTRSDYITLKKKLIGRGFNAF